MIGFHTFHSTRLTGLDLSKATAALKPVGFMGGEPLSLQHRALTRFSK